MDKEEIKKKLDLIELYLAHQFMPEQHKRTYIMDLIWEIRKELDKD